MKVYIINWFGKSAAAKSLGTTLHDFNNYASETFNDHDIAVAMSSPDAVFEKSFNHEDDWKIVKK